MTCPPRCWFGSPCPHCGSLLGFRLVENVTATADRQGWAGRYECMTCRGPMDFHLTVGISNRAEAGS